MYSRDFLLSGLKELRSLECMNSMLEKERSTAPDEAGSEHKRMPTLASRGATGSIDFHHRTGHSALQSEYSSYSGITVELQSLQWIAV